MTLKGFGNGCEDLVYRFMRIWLSYLEGIVNKEDKINEVEDLSKEIISNKLTDLASHCHFLQSGMFLEEVHGYF